MSFFNQVTLVGRLVADPEMRYTQSGVPVVSFRLAVEREFKNADGKRDADFINCTAWRKVAEIIAQYCKKGGMILASGSLQQDNYEKDGEKRTSYKVVVDKLRLLGSKPNGQQSGGGGGAAEPPVNDSDLPF